MTDSRQRRKPKPPGSNDLFNETSIITFRDYRATDRNWVATANVRHYMIVEGFESGFADAVSEALDLLEKKLEDRASCFLIAEAAKNMIGCVFFTAETITKGRLRLFYLDESYRGQGIGRAMLDRIIEHAQGEGFDRIHVSTFDRHVNACRLYQSAGFQSVIGEPLIAFGQSMRQVDFELYLPDHS
ncbi:GNAT family N-acetyltransferase [Halomonas sp. PR-M31]|uniref:GNAT family N-acetyltransferase n=1 Tax=Halomonas sp. PR-M31 TaxID=1471202 RepID=UPI000650ABD2|nr:GNAT family N-acetyltransferase [Halomonas sp. PR-M31]